LVSATKVAALFTGGPASRATAWLVLEALLSIEFLLTRGELEIDATISALQNFVFKHGFSSSVFLLSGLETAWLFDLSGRQNKKRRTGTGRGNG